MQICMVCKKKLKSKNMMYAYKSSDFFTHLLYKPTIICNTDIRKLMKWHQGLDNYTSFITPADFKFSMVSIFIYGYLFAFVIAALLITARIPIVQIILGLMIEAIIIIYWIYKPLKTLKDFT